LGVVDEGFGFRNWHEPDGLVGLLSEPFRLREEWNDLSSMPLPDLAELDEGEYDRRLEQFEKTYWSDELVNGAMPICHEGCAMRILLALTGTQAGNLWEDRRSEYGGLRPVLLSDGSKARFGSWYLEWLDACLASAKS
jgi:hypothetical protein